MDPKLSPVESLQVATGIVNSFQSATQQADGKIGILLVIQPGAVMILGSQCHSVVSILTAGRPVSLVLLLSLAVFAGSFLISGYHLFQAIRPRAAAVSGSNRFAFPSVAGGTCLGLELASAVELRDEAWVLAQVLARTAADKNRHLLATVRWIVPLVLATMVCGLVTVSG